MMCGGIFEGGPYEMAQAVPEDESPGLGEVWADTSKAPYSGSFGVKNHHFEVLCGFSSMPNFTVSDNTRSMQKTKDHIRSLLLKTATEAFFKKGFKAVSMRENLHGFDEGAVAQ